MCSHRNILVWITFLLTMLVSVLACGPQDQTSELESLIPTSTAKPITTATVDPKPSPTPRATAKPLPATEPTAISAPKPTPYATPTVLSPTPVQRAHPTFTPKPKPTPTATPVALSPYGSIQTGPGVSGMKVFDRVMSQLIDDYNIPGGALAIVNDGRLVFARGYGLADIENQEPVQPDSLFRIASLSKAFTAAAILKLVETGKVDLDERAFEILDQFQEPEGTTRDPRIDQITVRQLLHHSAGWDREAAGFDPTWTPSRVALNTGAPEPIACPDVIAFMLGQPLDFEPGTQYAYSNFGYCVLGRIIEKKSGQEYEAYVKQHVLAPLEITRMQIGGSLLNQKAEDEVRYYQQPGEGTTLSVFPEGPKWVTWPYGGQYIAGKDSLGGWIASAVDLARFISGLDGSKLPSLLKTESIESMLARPDPPLTGTKSYYGFGWAVRPIGDDGRWSHSGLFNSRPENQPGTASH